MVLCELSQVVVDIKHDGDRDDQCDAEEVVSQELLDDVPIQSFDVSERVDVFQESQEPQLMTYPAHRFDEPCEMFSKPSFELVQFAMFPYLLKSFHYFVSKI